MVQEICSWELHDVALVAGCFVELERHAEQADDAAGRDQPRGVERPGADLALGFRCAPASLVTALRATARSTIQRTTPPQKMASVVAIER